MKTLGYCVSAISRLTRQREVITPECSQENARRVCHKVLSAHPRKRSYIYPRVELITRQMELKFNFDK